MKSFIDPLFHILESIPVGSQGAADAISQFISTCELDSEILHSMSVDPNFPSFVRHLTAEAVVNMKESIGITSVSDLASSILQFLSSISMRHPVIHEIITSNTCLDDIITNFFDLYIYKADLRNINAPAIFPYLKFIGILSSSQRVDITQPKTLEIVFHITSSLLENPQLSAWAAAIIAGLSRNCPAAEAHLKTMPNLLQVKRDLSSLFASNDVCIVCAALSATVSLFPIGTDAVSALRAATHFISSESQFQLLMPLACSAIRDLVKKTKLTDDELTTILMAALTAKGYNAFTLFNLLTDLSDYHSTITAIIKTTEYLETLFSSLLSHDEEYVTESGCNLLLSLSDYDPQLFNGLNESNLFSEIFHVLLEIPNNVASFRSEPFIILLRLLFTGGAPKKSDIALLTNHEDFIFTTFLRHVENNESYLSVSLFLFIQQCSKYIKGWSIRIKRIVIDSIFPTLVVNVIHESENKHATKDALNALLFFCNCKESEFLEMFLSSFILLVKKTHEDKANCINANKQLTEKIEQLTRAKTQSESHVDELTQMHAQALKELNESKTQSNQMPTIIQPSQQSNALDSNIVTDLKTKLEKFKADNRSLRYENDVLKQKYYKIKKICRELHKDNQEILSSYQNQNIAAAANKSFETSYNKAKADITKTTKVISAYTDRDFHHEETVEKLATAQKVIYEDSQKIVKLESDLRTQIAVNEQLKKDLENVTNELNNERNHSNKLQTDFEQIEKQNNQYRTTQKDINHVKKKYAAKRHQLQQQLLDIEKDRAKWESIAKFYHKLCQSKGDAVKEVYHVFT